MDPTAEIPITNLNHKEALIISVVPNAPINNRNISLEGIMIRYEVIIYWSDIDKTFIAEAPELAGCMADGATYKEALSNLKVVIKEWIETAKESGRHIPEPKGRLVFA